MGKADDMRRQREARHGGAATSGEAAEPDAASGRCSVCHKVKPVQQGLVANHQKGLGTRCAGSRRPPA